MIIKRLQRPAVKMPSRTRSVFVIGVLAVLVTVAVVVTFVKDTKHIVWPGVWRSQYDQQAQAGPQTEPVVNISSSLVIASASHVDKIDVSELVMTGKNINMDTCHELFSSRVKNTSHPKPLNTLVVFTGRWFFLRIQLPQVYRELRQNGGVIDRVLFILMKCTEEDYRKLAKFALAANVMLREEVFSFQKYTDHVPYKHGKLYGFAYCEMHAYLLKYPQNHYFKLDDDVVYIHPGAFRKAIEYKEQNPKCLVCLFNIAGGNWMINKIYQENGVFNGLENPSHVDFNKVHGEGDVTSTTFALGAFLHYHKLNQLDKLFIDSRFTSERFTINAAMYDATTFDIETIRKAGPVNFNKDEPWWTVKFPKAGGEDRSNCIVGEALVVHFSHADSKLAKKLIDKGALEKFELLVAGGKKSMKMKDDVLWDLLEYTTST